MTTTVSAALTSNSQQPQNIDFNKRVGKQYLNRFGRFKTVRQAYSIYMNQMQKLNPTYYQENLEISNESIFTGLDPDKCVAEMKETAVYLGLQLPASYVKEIYQFARTNTCIEPKFNGEFLASEVKKGYLPSGRQVTRGLVSNPASCPYIEKIIHDPLLIEIAKKYLNYYPTLITRHLTWSFASGLPSAEIQKIYPTTKYHYDVAGLNFMTISFFITNVDLNSGPHVMIKYSHNKKPLQMVLSSNIKTSAEVINHYGTKNLIYITGQQGFGFAQDPSCFHRLKPPVSSDRLILQIRYS